MKRIYQNCLSGLLLSFTAIAYAQVGVNTTNPQAQLDIVASNPAAPSNTDGFLVPRIDAFPATNPTASQQGMLVYLTTIVGVNQPGFYFWDDATTSWKAISAASASNDWSVNGNAGTTSGTHFIGTTDNQALDIRTNNTIKVRITSKGQIEVLNTGESVFIGENAGLNDDLSANQNVFIGTNAGQDNVTGISNVGIGKQSLYHNTSSNNSAVGNFSGESLTTGFNNVIFGESAMRNSISSFRNVAIGSDALRNNANGIENVALGFAAGRNNVSGTGNVFLGNEAGQNETTSNKLYIDNSSTATPLLYGDFATNLLRVNGTLNVNNAYNLPTTAGAANQVLQTDGAGVASWVNPSSLSISETDPQVSSATSNKVPRWNGTTLVDGEIFDNGTNVGVGTATPTDKVHVVGNIKVDGGKIPFVNTGNSVFIGENAGLNDDLSGNANVNVGNSAGRENTTGSGNVALGFGSSQNATTAQQNVALGTYSLRNNIVGNFNTSIGTFAGENATGSTNVFIGYRVGQNETGSNKLFIDNTNTANPLLYGDFATDLLRVNGTLNINNAYNLPTTSGIANQVLQTNGAGITTWVDSSSLSITETDPQVSSTTTNYLPKWNGTTLIDGQVFDNGTNVGVGTATPTEKLEVNGKTKTTNIQVTGGATNGYVLQSDATGNGAWVNPTSLSITETDPQVASTISNKIPRWNGTSLVDGAMMDDGSFVGIGATVPQTKLHVVGTVRVEAGRLDFRNTGGTTAVGTDAGINDDQTTNYNTYVGYFSGKASTSGYDNVAIGAGALENTSTGFFNTALGRLAGLNNSTGKGNVFLGYAAGYNETGSDKLYIDNSSTSSPLIFGDFDTNLLRVNGTLNINNAYNLPTTAGTANQILQTDGAGTTAWVDSSTITVTEIDPQVSSTTTNYIPKWNGTTLVDGQMFDNGVNVGIGNNNPNALLTIGATMTPLPFLPKVSVNTTGNSPLFIGETTGQKGLILGYDGNNIQGRSGANFTINNDLILNNYGGNVGVGTASPTEKLDINGKTKTTHVQITNGATSGYVLQSDATGNGTWVNPTSLSIAETDPQVSSTTTNYIPKWNGTTLVDGQVFDNGTNVGIGTSTPTDKVHVVGNIKVDGGKLPFINTGGSVFIGLDAGLNDDLVTNDNTYVGGNAGKANVGGIQNVALGSSALELNTNSRNTAVGFNALNSNVNGTNNLALGNFAGATSTGSGNILIGGGAGESTLGSNNILIGTDVGKTNTLSNKLMIDNSGVGNPLIWGDFATDLLRVNGTLNINNAYNLPTNSGTANQVLQTNGAGATSWVNASTLTITETDPQVSSTTTNYIPKWNGTTLVDGQIFDNGTNVGIGTVTPTQAKFVVNGFDTNTFANYGFLNRTTPTGTVNPASAQNYSIYASNRIAASEFNAFSDARIKNIKGVTDTHKDLETLSQLEITNYTLKDSIAKGKRDYKKVIAQQVEKVYPQAVSKLTDVIPDIYAKAQMVNGFVAINNDLKPGEKVKIITESGETLAEVLQANSQGFKIESSKTEQVFVYGRQVSDFRSVDYEALSTLNISATQELLKRIQVLEQENTSLKAEVGNLANLRAEMDAIKAMLLERQNKSESTAATRQQAFVNASGSTN